MPSYSVFDSFVFVRVVFKNLPWSIARSISHNQVVGIIRVSFELRRIHFYIVVFQDFDV